MATDQSPPRIRLILSIALGTLVSLVSLKFLLDSYFTEMFETDVAEVLVPELKPGDVVVWDNPKPHLSDKAIEAVEAAGARVVPLPPYSPDLTPIEEMFSKVKGAMRSAAARTTESVYAAFCSALHDVTPEDIAGWFGDRAAYAMQL